MSARSEIAERLVAAGRRLSERGILWSVEGNLSARLPDGGFLTTPSGAHKGHLTPAELVEVAPDGTARGGAPSSELPMHLAVYEERPDVRAVVHAHPPTATGFAVAGVELPRAALAESLQLFGCVPVAPYGTPSTAELADSVRGPVREFDALLLANHGAVTVGADPEQATERMMQLEHLARIALVAHQLGGARPLQPEQIAAISRLRTEAGASPVPAVCYPSEGESGTITLTRGQLVELIADALRNVR